MADGQEFGARVTVLREQCGLSQEEFAHAFGFGWTQSDVSKLERGTKRLEIPHLVRIAEMLGVSIAVLFEHDEEAGTLPILTPELRNLLRAGALLPPPFIAALAHHARILHQGLRGYIAAQVTQER